MEDRARILFVDDEKRVLNSMRGLFRREYELFLTCEGAEAVKIADENEIDVIVADQRMPGMTGIEVLAKIKERSPRTVRILLTGYADPSAVEGSINIGEVFRFLSKPCPPKELRETLSLAIEAARTTPIETKPPTLPVATSSPVSPPLAADSSAPESRATAATAPMRPAEVKFTDQPQTPAIAEPEPPIQDAPPQELPLADTDETHPALPVLDESVIAATGDHSSTHWQSVTNVIMSEDNVEETQEQVALTTATLGVHDVGVVVFTVDSEFATSVIRAVSPDRPAYLATTLIKVAQAIEQHNAGVLVTDFTSNKTALQRIIGVLKHHMPELVTITVSDGRDTTDMIRLINYGQVFRYLLKPIDAEKLRDDVHAAVIRHLYLLNNPESTKRHKVTHTPETVDSSHTVNQFLGRIRNLKPRTTDPTDTLS